MKKLESLIKGIWNTYQAQWETLLMVAQLSFSQIRDLKKNFLARLSKTYSTAVLPGAVNLSLSWPILCAIVITLIIVGFFLGVLSTN